MKSVNGDGLAPYTLQVYQGGEWIDMFPRLGEDGKIPDALLSALVALLEEDGKLPVVDFPIELVPPFDQTDSVVAGTSTNSTTTLASALMLFAPVTAGKYCDFRVVILYSAASNAGARFTINGPAADVITYHSHYPISSTSATELECDDYQQAGPGERGVAVGGLQPGDDRGHDSPRQRTGRSRCNSRPTAPAPL